MNLSVNALILCEINNNLVHPCMCFLRQTAKQQSAKNTSLSIVIVSTNIQYLLEKQEIFKAEQAFSSVARSAHSFRFIEHPTPISSLFAHELESKHQRYLFPGSCFLKTPQTIPRSD